MKLHFITVACMAYLLSACGNSSVKESAIEVQADITSNSSGIEKQKSLTYSPPETEKSNNELFAVMEKADSAATSVPPGETVLQSGNPVINDWDKKIIKTAHVTLELEDYDTYNTSIHIRLKGYGAYIAAESQQETTGQILNEMTIKVPVDKFDILLQSIAGDGIKILEKNITTEDVTGEMVDTKARREAKKAIRSKYMELLKQAKNMEEILQVQNEINAIQEEMEAAASRISYLGHASSYSTINMKYFQYFHGFSSSDADPGFFTKAGEAFNSGISVVYDVLLFFISIWPLAVAVIIGTVYLKKGRLKKA